MKEGARTAIPLNHRRHQRNESRSLLCAETPGEWTGRGGERGGVMGKVTRRWVDGGGQPGGERGRERADRACKDKETLWTGRREGTGGEKRPPDRKEWKGKVLLGKESATGQTVHSYRNYYLYRENQSGSNSKGVHSRVLALKKTVRQL